MFFRMSTNIFIRTDLPATIQSSLTQNPLIQIRHLAAGLSRQMSKIELQMADNAPFAMGKNLYTGGEIAQRFLPPIQTLFDQRPMPQRIIFELLMELKDLVYMGMADCEKVLKWEVDGAAAGALVELDDAIVRAVTPITPTISHHQTKAAESGTMRRLRRKASSLTTSSSSFPLTTHQQPPVSFLLTPPTPSHLLYTLESLETTAAALTYLPLPIPDFCAHSIITLRRLAPHHALATFSADKKQRQDRCAEYARCMKWASSQWRANGGCRRGCKDEDDDEENAPSWHSCSRWFDGGGVGTCMVGGGRAVEKEDGFGIMRMRVRGS